VGVVGTLGIGAAAMVGSSLFKRLFEKGKKYKDKDKDTLNKEFASIRTSISSESEFDIKPILENFAKSDSFVLLEQMILKNISRMVPLDKDKEFEFFFEDIKDQARLVDNAVKTRVSTEQLESNSPLFKALSQGMNGLVKEASDQFLIRKSEKDDRDTKARVAGAITGAVAGSAGFWAGVKALLYIS
jgi:hypothetical protein